MRKKIEDKLLEKKIIELLEKEESSLSIREITKKLTDYYKIKRSPQIVLRHIENLLKTKKLIEN